MTTVIITAAGTGARFGTVVPKQFLPMKNGASVLENAVAAFEKSPCIDEIILTAPANYITQLQQTLRRFTKVTRIIAGRNTRAQSIREAIHAIHPASDMILIHDGVRPLVSTALIAAIAQAARQYGAAIPGLPCVETLKQVNASGEITATVDRARLWQVQTPQGFNRALLCTAYENIADISHLTDDASLIEANGGTVYIIPGEKRNLKITTPEDMQIANAILDLAHIGGHI
ncbi:MAG: 2-C-methyl-D-erythritol 4-phosphate cytidylyltransferase [Defluviitaleaceae bacterium]|nr:2-C-methyl-D-erythritol 4-phosphate cytidylyltransferase [Defluviitaleaceae bacterium]